MVWKGRKLLEYLIQSFEGWKKKLSDTARTESAPGTLDSGSGALERGENRRGHKKSSGRDKRAVEPDVCEVLWEGSPQKSNFRCETAPWTREDAHSERVIIQVASFVEQRIEQQYIEETGYLDVYPEYTRRMRLWGVVQLAYNLVVPEEVLLRSSGPGRSFTLTPHPRSSVPMQWIHVGPGAITDDLADIPCSDMQAIDLLDQLNSVHDTGYSLDVPGLQKCLEYTLRQSRDFGVAYGTLRPWWSSDFTEVVDHLEQQRIRLEYTRSNAIRGQCIIDSDIPARRIWDLYSNRVLPFHVLPRVPDSWAEAMPPIIWCVSHSWVDERDRHDVWTRINSEEWPVPLPRTTSLSHIRVELLNMGAQYVWLDVLCLRQRGGRLAEADAERAAEWRLDVPTIGKIYQRWQATCIIYFNGLGLPLDTTPAVLSSPQHWCNRAWTLQEGCRGWLPAGIDPSRPIGHDFFRGLDERRGQLTGFLCNLESAVFMRDRFCSTELDKIAGLAYIFQTRTLPVYSERTPVEHAWLLLLKNLQEDLRTQIFFQYAPATPFEIWVPWERFIEGRPELPFWDSIWILDDRPKDDREPLQLLNTDDLYTNNPQPRYCHEGWAIGHCRVATTIRQTTGDAKKNIRLNVRRRSESSSLVFAGMTGLLLPEVEYFLIAFELGHRKGYPPWLIAIEVVAEEEASTSEAGTQGLKTVEGVRWAVLYMDKDQKVALDSGSPDTRVVYLPGEEALARTQYRKQYLSALAETSLIR